MTTLWNECRLYKRIHNTGIWADFVCILYTIKHTPHSYKRTNMHIHTRTHTMLRELTPRNEHIQCFTNARIFVSMCVCVCVFERARASERIWCACSCSCGYVYILFIYAIVCPCVCVCKCACVCNSDSDSVYKVFLCLCLFMSIRIFSSWWSSTITDGIRIYRICMRVHVNFECLELRLPVLLFYIFFFIPFYIPTIQTLYFMHTYTHMLETRSFNWNIQNF